MDIAAFLIERCDDIDNAIDDQLEPQALHERRAHRRRPDEVGGIQAEQMREHVKAWRRLLTEIELITITRADGEPDPSELERPAGRMLRALAAPYADHPDYDPTWRIS